MLRYYSKEKFSSIHTRYSGSQQPSSGDIDSHEVESYSATFNAKSPYPTEITFSVSGKNIKTIEGGTCSAMSLHLALEFCKAMHPLRIFIAAAIIIRVAHPFSILYKLHELHRSQWQRKN